MEETTNEVIPQSTMNPTQLERIGAPVIVNSATPDKAYGCDPFAQLGQQHILNGIQITDKDVKDAEANIRYGVKDSEANLQKSDADIRHDVLFEGQENQKTSLEVEARLKDRLTIDRNASDAQFMALDSKVCTLEKEVIKSGYEARIEALKNTERITDKIAHSLEEIREDLCECCKNSEVNATTTQGLLAQIVHAVVK